MSKDKGITEGQRRAGSGESYVEARLKSFAQVSRPVHLFEYAIDFYCRLLQNGQPSNKIFGVEVKSTNHFNDRYSESIDKETVRFWLTQPFPVFVVVYEESSDSCYWISVEENREKWLSKLLDGKKSVTITVDRSRILENRDAKLIKKIEEDMIIVNASRGISQFITEGYEGYAFGYIPILRLSDEARASIKQTIRGDLNYLINDCIFFHNDFHNAYSLGRLLASFDHGHYDHFLLLARICRKLLRKEEARENYKIAIAVLKADPEWDKKRLPGIPRRRDVIKTIENELLSLDDAKSALRQRN